ncbi:hypothetical protein NNO07_06145 [Pseudomonas resinovorans]|uniref:Uncharacterized protein n=1 Tax=Metapseudomonas resinovorans TaxID=53412 RepID=A0ABT4Y1E3_METRE|nr:hypothetical protein [Pseudomonas resinovorans]MDA8482644.1 hypothetical protein [Pseudomonas resinovorans]
MAYQYLPNTHPDLVVIEGAPVSPDNGSIFAVSEGGLSRRE